MFNIDPDIRKARTLPTEFYTDERSFELSKERIFARTWQFAGTADDLDSLRPFDLLPGFLDEPLLLSKDADGLHCLSNVCTHRGKIIVEQPYRANLIRCGYHGRRFSLDGKFLSMPEFEDIEGFPCEEDNLKSVPLDQWGNFLFTSLKPAAALNEFVGDAGSMSDPNTCAETKFASSKDYQVNAHWALYCENYLEGFHIPYVHRSLNDLLDYGAYSTELFRYSSLQIGQGKDGVRAANYLFIFPNLMFNFYPWGISVNIVKPVSPSRTVVSFLNYVFDESKLEGSAGADLHRVELEDEAVVESVQKGIRSRFYSHGRYSPTREQGTHHFHRLIAEFME